MSDAGKLTVIIVAAGLALGGALGAAANPKMKQPPAQWWQSSARGEGQVSSADSQWIDSSPQYPGLPDSYRPALDYDTTVTSYWDEPEDWRWYGDDGSSGDVENASTEMDATSVENAQLAAEDAEGAVEAALAQAPSAPTEPGLGRKSQLASNGLY